MGYKDHWPKRNAEGRWVEAGTSRLSDDEIAEWQANTSWLLDARIHAHEERFRQFLKSYDGWGRGSHHTTYSIEEIEEYEKELKVHKFMQGKYDDSVEKLLHFMKRHVKRAEEDPNLFKPGARDSLDRLKVTYEKLDTLLDLKQLPPKRVEKKELSKEQLEPLKSEYFRLYEHLQASDEVLKKIEEKISETIKLLNYKLDGKEIARRDSLGPLEVQKYEKEQQDRKKNLGSPKTDHDMAREWGFQLSHIQHAHGYYEELGSSHAEARRPEINPRMVEMMKRTLELNKDYADRYLKGFFDTMTGEEKISNEGVLEGLAGIKKLVAEFEKVSDIGKSTPTAFRQ
ncbi:MAG: hypothetical protein P8P30_00665 [Rickettsiales bacterium]|nr:hypothetical protein [Rickettsiales bacterium]